MVHQIHLICHEANISLHNYCVRKNVVMKMKEMWKIREAMRMKKDKNKQI